MNHLYFTVGLSGVGKSYWADCQAAENDVILDSDMIRAELWGDASDQQNPTKVFNTMFNRACDALKRGKNVYYCQTGLSMKHRLHFVNNMRAIFDDSVKLHCVILIAPIEVCKERNTKRSRHVPDEVIDRQVRQFQVPVENEGWDSIRIIRMDYDKDIERIKLLGNLFTFGDQENRHHSLPLYQHCNDCANIIGIENLELYGAASFHDVGKIYTKTYWRDKDDDAHYPNHGEVGSYLVLVAGYSLHIAQLVCYHMLPYNKQSIPTWQKRLGKNLWNEIMELHAADRSAH